MSHLVRSQNSTRQQISRHWTTYLLAVLILLITGSALAVAKELPVTFSDEVEAKPLRYIVRVARQAQGVDNVAQSISSLRVAAPEGISRQGLADDLELWTADDSMDSDSMMAELENHHEVLSVEPDFQRQPHNRPDDSQFGSQWYAENNGGVYFGQVATAGADLGLVDAWRLVRGDHKVVVAIIDNGLDLSHPDLRNNLWINRGEIAGNGIDDDRNGFVDDVHGYDFANRDGNPDADEARNHGTAVAGVLGAQGNNARGLAGASWQVSIMVLKTDFSVSATMRAMEYARQNGAHVVNTSFGGSQFSQNEFEAIERLQADGILMVASAGNEHWNNDFGASYPGSYPLDNILVVGASTPSDSLTSWSQHGQISVDVAAPGAVIMTTEGKGTDTGSRYGLRNGTSFSAPLVAGVAALLKSAHPNADYSELKGRIMASADTLNGAACTTNTGGRVNAHKALQIAPQPVPALSQWLWVDGNDGRIDANESGTLRLEFETFWQRGGATQLLLRSGDSRLQVNTPIATVNAMPLNERFTVDSPITAGALSGFANLPLSVQFTAPGFSTQRDFCVLASSLTDSAPVNGQLQQNAQDDVHRFTINVPNGADVLELTLDAGNNADLYLRHADWPQRDEVLRRSGSYGNGDRTFVSADAAGTERVTIEQPEAGVWYVAVVNAAQRSNDYRLTSRFDSSTAAAPKADQARPAPITAAPAAASGKSSGGGGGSAGGLLLLVLLLARRIRRA